MFPEHVERSFLDPEYSFDEYFQLGSRRNIRPIKNGLDSQHRKLTLAEKSLAAPGTRACVSIASCFSFGHTSNWAIRQYCILLFIRTHFRLSYSSVLHLAFHSDTLPTELFVSIASCFSFGHTSDWAIRQYCILLFIRTHFRLSYSSVLHLAFHSDTLPTELFVSIASCFSFGHTSDWAIRQYRILLFIRTHLRLSYSSTELVLHLAFHSDTLPTELFVSIASCFSFGHTSDWAIRQYRILLFIRTQLQLSYSSVSHLAFHSDTPPTELFVSIASCFSFGHTSNWAIRQYRILLFIRTHLQLSYSSVSHLAFHSDTPPTELFVSIASCFSFGHTSNWAITQYRILLFIRTHLQLSYSTVSHLAFHSDTPPTELFVSIASGFSFGHTSNWAIRQYRIWLFIRTHLQLSYSSVSHLAFHSDTPPTELFVSIASGFSFGHTSDWAIRQYRIWLFIRTHLRLSYSSVSHLAFHSDTPPTELFVSIASGFSFGHTSDWAIRQYRIWLFIRTHLRLSYSSVSHLAFHSDTPPTELFVSIASGFSFGHTSDWAIRQYRIWLFIRTHLRLSYSSVSHLAFHSDTPPTELFVSIASGFSFGHTSDWAIRQYRIWLFIRTHLRLSYSSVSHLAFHSDTPPTELFVSIASGFSFGHTSELFWAIRQYCISGFSFGHTSDWAIRQYCIWLFIRTHLRLSYSSVLHLAFHSDTLRLSYSSVLHLAFHSDTPPTELFWAIRQYCILHLAFHSDTPPTELFVSIASCFSFGHTSNWAIRQYCILLFIRTHFQLSYSFVSIASCFSFGHTSNWAIRQYCILLFIRTHFQLSYSVLHLAFHSDTLPTELFPQLSIIAFCAAFISVVLNFVFCFICLSVPCVLCDHLFNRVQRYANHPFNLSILNWAVHFQAS